MSSKYSPLLADDKDDVHKDQTDLEQQRNQRPTKKVPTIQVEELKEGPAVVKSISKQTLGNVKPVNPKDQSLVKEFWYRENDEEGLVWFEKPLEFGEARYARLVGIDSFTQELSTCLLTVSLQISKVMAQASFCNNLLTKAQFHTTPIEYKVAYICIFVAGVLLWIGSSFRAARSKLKSDELTGDNVKEANRIVWIKFMLSSLLFQMFNVPDKISEVPIRFHPRKGVQPYAALKLQKHRFWILGWPSQEQYQYENGAGLLSQLPMTILLTFPLVALQVFIGKISFVAMATIVLSALSLLWQMWLLCKILEDRKGFYTELKESVHGGLASFANIDGAGNEKEMLVKYKLLQKHFHEEPPQEVKEKFKEFFVRE